MMRISSQKKRIVELIFQKEQETQGRRRPALRTKTQIVRFDEPDS